MRDANKEHFTMNTSDFYTFYIFAEKMEKEIMISYNFKFDKNGKGFLQRV